MHRYLLIDDDNIFNFIHTEVIKKVDPEADIIAFNSSSEGLDHLTGLLDKGDELPHFLFLDIRMPEMDGFEILSRLKDHPDNRLDSMRIYMLTSSLDDRDQARAAESRFVKGFKSKSLTPAMLTEILKENSDL